MNAFYTINLRNMGGALMNGLGQVKFFTSEESANEYLSELDNREPRLRDCVIQQAHLVN